MTCSRSVKRDKTAALECDVPGCDHRGPFARKYELRRHVRSKHGGTRAYTCGAKGCFKRGKTRWTFPRLDKLTDHIRTVHAHDTLFSGCPVDNCSFGPQTLGLLGVHIQRAHPRCQAEARSILNSTATGRRRCPLSGCNNKMFPLGDFPAHLETHDFDDLRAASSNACFDGLVFDVLTSPGIPDVVTPGVRIRVACPACSDVCPSFENLKTHLWERHLFLDPLHGLEHFLGWQSYLARFGVAASLPWQNRKLVLTPDQHAQCPMCRHSLTHDSMNRSLFPGAQHPGLVKPIEQIDLELKHIRMQILSLYPEFLSHPIFDDCA